MVLMEYHNGGYSKSWSDVPPGSDEYAWETWERVTRRGLAPEGTGTNFVSWLVTVRTRGGPPDYRHTVRQWGPSAFRSVDQLAESTGREPVQWRFESSQGDQTRRADAANG